MLFRSLYIYCFHEIFNVLFSWHLVERGVFSRVERLVIPNFIGDYNVKLVSKRKQGIVVGAKYIGSRD